MGHRKKLIKEQLSRMQERKEEEFSCPRIEGVGFSMRGEGERGQGKCGEGQVERDRTRASSESNRINVPEEETLCGSRLDVWGGLVPVPFQSEKGGRWGKRTEDLVKKPGKKTRKGSSDLRQFPIRYKSFL